MKKSPKPATPVSKGKSGAASGGNTPAGGAKGERPAFDIDAAKLPKEIADRVLSAGGYPYDKKLKREPYEEELVQLQIELLKLQSDVQANGRRVVVVFEGRDTAGKGGCIARFMQHLNPRHARAVALAKPTEAERGQWYFQRYAAHMPTRGDIVLFDRSWYNRAGVERVMGFCSKDQLADFLRDAPAFEDLLARDGIHLFKLFLTIGRETQLARFHERRHDPLKRWKLTEIDLAAMAKWDDYTQAQHEMFRFTHTTAAPWTVIRSNDQRRARLEAVRMVLSRLDYVGKDTKLVAKPDRNIVGADDSFLYG